jgi:hypothetical protein
MKYVIGKLVEFVKVTVMLGVLLFGTFFASTLLIIFMLEMGFEHKSEFLDKAKANCVKDGGEWIVNPNSYIKHRVFGEGCSLHYQARK